MRENSRYYPLPPIRKPEPARRKPARRPKRRAPAFELDGGVRKMLAVLAVLLAILMYVNLQEPAPTTTMSAQEVDTGEGFADFEEDLFQGVEPEW